MIFTTKSASVPVLATCSSADTGPATVMSSVSTSERYTSTSGRREAKRWSSVGYIALKPNVFPMV